MCSSLSMHSIKLHLTELHTKQRKLQITFFLIDPEKKRKLDPHKNIKYLSGSASAILK